MSCPVEGGTSAFLPPPNTRFQWKPAHGLWIMAPSPTPLSFDLQQHWKAPASSTVPFQSSEPEQQYTMVFKGVNHVRKIKWESFGSGAPRRRLNFNRGSTDKTDKTCGSSVSPGVPLTRAEQETRRDSKISLCGLDGQSDDKVPTAEEGFAWLAAKMRLDSPQLDVFLPEADPYLAEDWHRRRPGNLRALIVFVILLLIVFGAIYSLVEYLLFATRVSAASCTPSTVYIPVTRYASASAATTPADGNYTTSMVTIYSTSTSWLTTTSYATVSPDVMATGLTTSGGPSYYFTVDSAGSTDWLNGISPPATASLTVITRSIFVTPVMPTASQSTTTATITSTAVLYQTITVPAYTSTFYSDTGPENTVTSTSTNYVTYTLSRVSPASSAGTTGPRPSYTGPGTYGWNSSSVNAPGPTDIAAAAEADPQLTTMTEIHYWGDGDATTSTSTRFITTSMQIAYTTVLTPSVPEPSDSPEIVTTVTALPVTITYSSGQFSTSIAFNGSAVSPATVSTSSSSRSSPYQTGVSSSAPGLSTGASSSAQSTISGVFTNSTSPATVSAAGYSSAVSPLSSLSSSLSTANASTAGPLTGSTTSSSLLATTSVSTAPGLISTSANANLTISSTPSGSVQETTSQASASTQPAGASSTSNLVSSPALSSTSTFSNSTLAATSSTASSSSGSSSAAPSSSSEAAPVTSASPSPAYGSYSALSVPTSSVTAGPINSSSASSSVSLSPATSFASISNSASSSSGTMSAWSTSVRSSSNSASIGTAASSSSLSSSLMTPNTTATPPPTIALSSESRTMPSGPSSSVSIISYSQTYVPTTMSAIPATASPMPATGCGEYGNVTLDFDNLPNYTPNNQNQTDITQAPPIENPYHHFAFSDGYVYAPDPKVPFEPISQPHLAVFLGNGTGMKASQSHAHTIEDGEFADGPYEASTSFWFDAYSAWLGCDNEGPEVCTLVMSAYTYSSEEGDEVLAYQKNATIPGCPGFKDCKLQKVEFPDTFKGLSGLQIQAFVGEEERMFFMDDVAMHWTENSCIAGLTRQRAR